MFGIKEKVTALALASAFLLSACGGHSAPVVNGNSGTVYTNTAAPAGYYRVQRGDNLFRIGLKFNQNTKTLSAWNGLSDPSQIEVGQLLRVSKNTSGKTTTSKNKPSNTSGNKNTSKPTTPVSTGKVNIRMQKPANGTIIANFNGGTNKGIDIGGRVGDPIVAAAAGQVMYVGSGVRGYGNLILIKHNSTVLTAYAHNQSMLVKQGQNVSAGQKIATMGKDEDDGRAKLHFEVRVNGKAVNPSPYL